MSQIKTTLRCDWKCHAQRKGFCQAAGDQTNCFERRVHGDGKPVNPHPDDPKRGAFCGSCGHWEFDEHCKHLDTRVAADWPSGVCWTANASGEGRAIARTLDPVVGSSGGDK